MLLKIDVSYERLTQEQVKDLPVSDEVKSKILVELETKIAASLDEANWMDTWAEVWDKSMATSGLQKTDSRG